MRYLIFTVKCPYPGNGCNLPHNHQGGIHQLHVGPHQLDQQTNRANREDKDPGATHQLVFTQTVAIPPPSPAVAPYTLPPPPMRVTAPTPTVEDISTFNCKHCGSIEPNKHQQQQQFQPSNQDTQHAKCQKEPCGE